MSVYPFHICSQFEISQKDEYIFNGLADGVKIAILIHYTDNIMVIIYPNIAVIA